VPKTWFNVAGFVQLDVIVGLLNGNDYDGFADRQFFVCPPEVDADYDEMRAMPEGTPDFKRISTIIDEEHSKDETNFYTLHEDAHVEFVAYHDELNERKRQEHQRDRDRNSVLSKAKGQVIRLSSVSCVLRQAICKSSDETFEWSYIIPKQEMLNAMFLMNYLVEQKFALGKPKTVTS
jgi:hypothetical protein